MFLPFWKPAPLSRCSHEDAVSLGDTFQPLHRWRKKMLQCRGHFQEKPKELKLEQLQLLLKTKNKLNTKKSPMTLEITGVKTTQRASFWSLGAEGFAFALP